MDHRSLLLTVLALTVSYHLFQGPEEVYYSPDYPNETVLDDFVSQQIELAYRHNKYELENGFVLPDKMDQASRKCENYCWIRERWMDYMRFKHYYEDKDFNKISTYCSIYKSSDHYKCYYAVAESIGDNMRFDDLLTIAKYCYVNAPRPNPNVKVIDFSYRRNKSNGKMEALITVDVFMPNGTKILDLRDDRLQLAYDDFWKCHFATVSSSQILLQYDENSGFTLCGFENVKRGNTYLRELVCDLRHCAFSFGWNWTNPVINSSNVSLWLVRHHLQHSSVNLNYMNIKLE